MESNKLPEDDYGNFADYLMAEESDRGCALVAAAAIDETLEQTLRSLFSSEKHAVSRAVDPLFAALGPLSSLSAKIRLIYALSFVDQDGFRDLEMIRKVRNEFAHSRHPVSFEDERIKQLVLQLKLGSSDIDSFPKLHDVTFGSIPLGPQRDAYAKEKDLVGRNKARFTMCAVLYMLQLQSTGERFRKSKT